MVLLINYHANFKNSKKHTNTALLLKCRKHMSENVHQLR